MANVYLEGTYSEVYPHIGRDEEGMRRLFRQFSFPGGIPSHVAPETPGSIHEGGELGYSLAHAYGAAFDNPDLLVCCVVGDGEAETGPLATSWHSNKFLDPARDGAVLPVLHLNGYKIANPTVLARIPERGAAVAARRLRLRAALRQRLRPRAVHQLMAATLDEVADGDRRDPARARARTARSRAAALADDRAADAQGLDRPEGGRRAAGRGHVPLPPGARSPTSRENPEHLAQLESWMRSYRPEELFDEGGALTAELAALAPSGERRMGSNPHANGGLLLRDLELPDFREYAVEVERPTSSTSEATRVLGSVPARRDRSQPGPLPHHRPRRDRLEPPRRCLRGDRPRLGRARRSPATSTSPADGQVMEVLSEHLCQGWLEGYLLTGRHGLFNCYEAFIHIVDSMFNQHAKWLKVSREVPWRRPIASLNYLLSSHVWRQDHNGFSHQDPGFIDHVVNKKAEIVRVYLPPDANCLLSVADHCLRSRDYVNVIVAGKQPALNYLTMRRGDRALHARDRHLGVGAARAATRSPTSCSRAPATSRRSRRSPPRRSCASACRELKVRVVNVVDLMRLEPESEHPHGLVRERVRRALHAARPVIFAYHGYPSLIHRLTYRRANHDNLHVRGYKEEGTTTTPFDMVMLNDLDRFHLVIDVIDRVPGLGRARRATCARRWSTSACATAPTRASTATTRPT